ncbi:MAG: ArdC-like ssDNA-binding domain-containing protein [Dehalococcoidia bacterium]
MAQKPDATLVAGFHRWKALGRHVRRGEKGIWIMVPYKCRVEPGEDGEGAEGERFVVTGFGLGTVFDVGQTDGASLPEPPPVQTELGATTAGELLDRRLSRWLIEESLVIVLMSQELDPASKADPRPGDCRA